MVLKITCRNIITSCFKGLSPPTEPKNQVCVQNSLQRLSLSDLSNPASPLSVSDISNSLIGSNLHIFTFSELKVITQNFSLSNFLGEGGFGPVHKGFIDYKTRPGMKPQPVAVKLLDLDGPQGHREWLAEVIFLGQLRHPNLVKLIGYCCEDEHRLLVYEFMARGNLENQLFRRYSISLPWSTRIKIAIGAAKGLAFVHEEEKPVIYRDFKASNILLDTDYTAKLSDFGLAKDGPEGDDTHVTTRVMGTQGYAAPEYIMTGHLTMMSDVYSFGVVLLELITGRRAMDKSRPSGERSLVEWARPLLKDTHNQKIDRIMDPTLLGQYSIEGAKKAALLAYQCVSHRANCRPTMSHVVNTLEPLMDLDDIPVEPFVYSFPTEGQKTDNVLGRRNEYEGKEEQKKENINANEEKEVAKEENGRGRQQKGHRHRHRIRSLRFRAVYSDTALYKTLRNGLDSPNYKRQGG